jgi:hypothetical protein
MLAQLLNDIFSMLIITLFLAFLWWTVRLHEITGEGNIDRLSEWMQVWNKVLPISREPPGKLWRWVIMGLLLTAYAFYVVPFHVTPFLARLFIVLVGLV